MQIIGQEKLTQPGRDGFSLGIRAARDGLQVVEVRHETRTIAGGIVLEPFDSPGIVRQLEARAPELEPLIDKLTQELDARAAWEEGDRPRVGGERLDDLNDRIRCALERARTEANNEVIRQCWQLMAEEAAAETYETTEPVQLFDGLITVDPMPHNNRLKVIYKIGESAFGLDSSRDEEHLARVIARALGEVGK